MRNALFAVLLSLLAIVTLPSAAEARGGGYRESFAWMADTEIFYGGEKMSLCTLVEQTLVFGVPVLNEAQAFVLAPDGCTGEYYYDYTEAQLLADIEAGLIPADAPREPSLSLGQQAMNVASLGGLGVFVIGGILFAFFKAIGGGKRRRNKRVNPELNEAALAAMCTVARADGEIDMQEANVVAAVSGEILGFQPKLQSILEMLHHAPANFNEINFVAFGQGFTEKEKRVIMRGALRTATADGMICEAEHRVINGLAGGLMISGDEVRQMLKDISKPANLRRVGAKNPNRYLAYQGRYENADGNFSAARNTGGILAGAWSAVRGLFSAADDLF